MKWVTREHGNVERVACPWLIQRFIDKDAEFAFVPNHTNPSDITDGIPYDMKGVELGHHQGRCSFESFLLKYGLDDDQALVMMGSIIHGADIPVDIDITPESAGLRAIAFGFHYLGISDHEKISLQSVMYDALYAWCQRKTGRLSPEVS
ncbi:chromate resistance protein ChrB domain-containing protein [Paenibacillus sp. MAH-36]|uniref:Chromate resistance protein n=1 Tax=Paenibacillus violae TaxID=3077234 RepID=A0ABU3RPZ0_9BACL|nr:chromate resistance protein ChrB domain-containing protein [Paenibacillus sp. PFR10]MDU0206372.1 chromate resistance protein [Paenibacillus sp. PFR10]